MVNTLEDMCKKIVFENYDNIQELNIPIQLKKEILSLENDKSLEQKMKRKIAKFYNNLYNNNNNNIEDKKGFISVELFIKRFFDNANLE
jgi:Leucine-rich repeat (LRR) protein